MFKSTKFRKKWVGMSHRNDNTKFSFKALSFQFKSKTCAYSRNQEFLYQKP